MIDLGYLSLPRETQGALEYRAGLRRRIDAALIEFVRARADERARDISWSGDAVVAWLSYLDGEGHILYTTVGARHHDEEPWVAAGKPLEEPSRVRVIYDPARARAEVAMRRAIIDRFAAAPDWPGGEDVRIIAALDRDHPDWQEEWA